MLFIYSASHYYPIQIQRYFSISNSAAIEPVNSCLDYCVVNKRIIKDRVDFVITNCVNSQLKPNSR
jgi:hypothetical protein